MLGLTEEVASVGIARPSAYRWVSVGMFLLLGVSSFMVHLALGLLLPAISDDLGLSPVQQGILSSAAFWASLVIAIPVGWWASRFNPRTLTTVMVTVASACIFVQAWAPGFIVLSIGRLVFGLTLVAREPARALLTLQWFPRREIVMVSSISNLLFGLVVGGGLAATPFILGFVDNDWRSVFRVFGIYFSVLTLLWLFLGREGPNRDRERRSPGLRDLALVKSALAYRDLWIAGFAFVGYMASYTAFLSFFPTLAEAAHGISIRDSGVVVAVGIAAGGIAGVGFGYLALDFDRGRAILRIMGVVVAATFVGMMFTGSLPVLLGLSLLNGIGSGFFPILYTVPFLLPGIRPREVAVASSFLTMCMSAGGVIGPLLAGSIEEAIGSLRAGLVVCGFLSVALTIAGLTLRVRSNQPSS